MQSRDGEFRINLGAYTQFRYDLLWLETPPVDQNAFLAGFTVPRTFFFFEGHFTPAIEYHLRMKINAAGDFAIQIAYAGYNFKDYHHRSRHNHGAWNLRAGLLVTSGGNPRLCVHARRWRHVAEEIAARGC